MHPNNNKETHPLCKNSEKLIELILFESDTNDVSSFVTFVNVRSECQWGMFGGGCTEVDMHIKSNTKAVVVIT